MLDIIKLFQGLSGFIPEIVTGIISVLSVIISVALVIPGEQPEKFLQKLVDFLSKFSRK